MQFKNKYENEILFKIVAHHICCLKNVCFGIIGKVVYYLGKLSARDNIGEDGSCERVTVEPKSRSEPGRNTLPS